MNWLSAVVFCPFSHGLTTQKSLHFIDQIGYYASMSTKGISPELYQNLKDNLLACEPFHSDETLSALFVDERLKLWQAGLPSAANRLERVERVINYLSDKSHARYGRALVSLLEVLKSRVDREDARYEKLESVIEAFGQEVKSKNPYEQLSAQPHQVPLHDVPSLPHYFLPRAEAMNILKEKVLADTGRPVAVQGMAGIGKTILVTALAHDEDVQTSFPDGIFWLTLGQKPTEADLISRQVQLAWALGERHVVFTDSRQGRAFLRDLLTDKTCLLILDDVWAAAHATELAVIDKRARSQLLITTRDQSIIRTMGALEQQLSLLDDETALMLLAQVTAYNINDQRVDISRLPSEASAIVPECGYLPLAIAMIAGMITGMVRQGQDGWGYALHRLQQADLSRIHHDIPDYPYLNLLKAIDVSVAALAEDESIAHLNPVDRYMDFAIFREDSIVPEHILTMLWESLGLDEWDTRQLLTVFIDRALIQIARREEGIALRLHDIQGDYVCQQARDIVERHERLLQSYATLCSDGWATGPNDDYFFQNIAHHLVQQEQVVDALALVEPDFRKVKQTIFGSDYSFIQDLELIVKSLEASKSPEYLPATIRCSLVQGLLTSVSHRVHPEVLSALVAFGSVERAKEIAAISPEGSWKVKQLVTIARTLKETGGDENLFRAILRKALVSTRLLTRFQVVEGQPDEFRTEIATLIADLDWDWTERILAEIMHEYHFVRSRIHVARIVAPNHERAIRLLKDVLPHLSIKQIYFFELPISLG